jgi:predicted lipoprotein with Yx(FWY)xxD motif
MKLVAAMIFALGSSSAFAGQGQVQQGQQDEYKGIEVTAINAGQSEEYGAFAVDSNGRSLYMFQLDTQGEAKSACSGECAAKWPPAIIAEGQTITLGQGFDQTKLGQFTREDGQVQLSYNGWPLYYFYKDMNAGDTYGQGVDAFGAEWNLIAPDGSVIQDQQGE